jgi:hypothetical protein
MSDYDFVTIEWMDDYIDDIRYRASIDTIPPEDMQIVKRHKEYKQKHSEVKKVEFKKIMFMLIDGQ